MAKSKKHSEETKKKISKALMNNNNAEIYTYDTAVELFNEALELSKNEEYDFIGEIAKLQGISRNLYDHLMSRFPDLKNVYSLLKSNLEANCYQNTKKNKINTAVGIINLKSNHKWNDRPQEEAPQEETKPVEININVVRNED